MRITSYKSRANAYQKNYLENVLRLKKGEYSTWLRDHDAEAGSNFYTAFPGLLGFVNSRYAFKNKKIMYKDMLRSEHVPFNLFGPLGLKRSSVLVTEFCKKLFSDENISQITDVKIEWPPAKANPLADRTSFDAYLEYESGQKEICGIGIEVKYTEKSYPFGKTEYENMTKNYKSSCYARVTIDSQLYNSNAHEQLATKKLKQTWRNHLLGASMVLKKQIIAFTSVLVYPSGNEYQREVSEEYQSLLTSDSKKTFVAVTYEEFIRIGREVFRGSVIFMDWLKYLDDRYIVK